MARRSGSPGGSGRAAGGSGGVHRAAWPLGRHRSTPTASPALRPWTTTTVAQTPAPVDVLACTVTGCSAPGRQDRLWLYAPGDPSRHLGDAGRRRGGGRHAHHGRRRQPRLSARGLVWCTARRSASAREPRPWIAVRPSSFGGVAARNAPGSRVRGVGADGRELLRRPRPGVDDRAVPLPALTLAGRSGRPIDF